MRTRRIVLPPRPHDHYQSPCKMPTPRQRELLGILQEECAEVIVATSKYIRFGGDDFYEPDWPDPNYQEVGRELGHVLCLVELCINAGLIFVEDVDAGMESKPDRLAKFLQTEEDVA